MKSVVKYTLLILLVFGIFIHAPLKNIYAQGCGQTEWNTIKSKYRIEEQFFKMQEVVNSTPFNQALYDSLKAEYDQSFRMAERECDSLKTNKTNQPNDTTYKTYQPSTPASNDDNSRLPNIYESQRQAICPPNSTLNGEKCFCNSGYIQSGNYCVLDSTQTNNDQIRTTAPVNTGVSKVPSPKVSTSPASMPDTNVTPPVGTGADSVDSEKGFISRIIGSVIGFIAGIFKF